MKAYISVRFEAR